MINKRVADSLRRQDWTAVAIEFALIVVGILLAFQINEWASERVARQEREAATQRLLDEAEETVAFFKLGVSAQHGLHKSLGSSLERLQSGKWSDADRRSIAAGLANSTVMTTPNPPSSVYDDLVSSGAFGTMGDPQMRAAVAKYEATLKFHRESIEYLRGRMPSLDEAPAFRFSFDSASRGPARLDIDFNELTHDQGLQEKLALVAEMQSIALVLRQRNLKRAIEMCQEIARFAGRPCNINRPLPSFD
jgi:hypothetical protein